MFKYIKIYKISTNKKTDKGKQNPTVKFVTKSHALDYNYKCGL